MYTDSMPKHHIGPLGWFLAFVLLASAIFFEAFHGPTIDNRIIPNLDKMAHVAAFGLLTFLLLRYLRSIGFANGWRILLGVGLTITVMGVLDEWVQSMVPGRTASPMDVLADVAGGLACMFFESRLTTKRTDALQQLR